jgi:tetratricopeptide (TPR) repeat protein
MNYPHRRAPAGRADRHDFVHAAGGEAALVAFAQATDGLLAYRRDTAAALERAIALAPGMAAAHALQGLALFMAGRGETIAQARACLAAALPTTADESAIVVALDRALATGPLAAAEVLDSRLGQRPGLALLVKLSTMLRFLGGDCPGMLATTEAVMPAWTVGMPGYGHVLGCHAFALEESGDYAMAEAAGRAAVTLEPEDPWAVHAVTHVLEMTGRAAEGIAWIEACRDGWSGCNNFAYHLSWHLGLFHLEHGDVPRVLALYDQAIRPDTSEDNRDFANAASLLWRLHQEGVDVGYRWNELADIARRRRAETTHVFTALHRLFPLIAIGDRVAARDLAAALARVAAPGEQPAIAAGIGAPLARALLEFLPSEQDVPADIASLAAALPPLGGSHAQRDVFLRSLIQLAANRRDLPGLDRILALRRQLRADDRFLRRTGLAGR